VITSDSLDPEATAHSRAWRIPGELAEAFASAMTERFGEPIHEGLSANGVLSADAAQAERDGRILFVDRDGDG